MSRRHTRVPEILAAVDLGSNSFHLVVARYRNGQIIIVDRLRDPVQLAAGIGEDGRLDKEAAARALACLKRFGQRIADVRADGVRVVGTSALRRARSKQAFLERARDALGHPIEIIAGREEARLIYSGVSHTSPTEPGNRLVVDIGGGSTELIVGKGADPLELESVNLGCVILSERFFPGGKVTAKRFEQARLAARQALEPVQEAFLKRGWDSASGSSGSARAVLDALKVIDPATTTITADALESLARRLTSVETVAGLPTGAVAAERAEVFPGGLAILVEVFSQLKIKQMRWAEGAMREGLLYDMVGRFTHEDARERTVRSMQQRYHVDLAQAARVEATAMMLLSQVQDSWQLDDPLAEQVLAWACRLHEIGLDVAHSGYHRHGAYLLENADMPGFAREEQLLLARLVGGHRRKPQFEGFDELVHPWDNKALYMALLLRLAVLLHRSRSDTPPPLVTLTGRPKTLELRFRIRSFRDHPLTAADLNDEVDYLRAKGLRLRVLTS
jgi:exopolyphosphatase / guanosine-5'-triphosphate,3'-diphosphate pyrophosphatase